MTELVKKWYNGIGIKLPILPSRARLLKNPEVIRLLRLAHLSGSFGESFESFLKTIR